jgi:hypothetical protein
VYKSIITLYLLEKGQAKQAAQKPYLLEKGQAKQAAPKPYLLEKGSTKSYKIDQDPTDVLTLVFAFGATFCKRLFAK